MPFIGYVRVSSAEQAERNISIPSQIDQINSYASNNSICLTKIYKEEHSAYKGKRPTFHTVLKELKTNKDIQGLIVFKYDRISRNMEDFLAIERIVRERGIEIISVTEPMLNSYLGRYMIRDMQNRAVLYSEELSFRIKLGMRKKLQLGGDIGGSPPYGFKRVSGYIIPDETKAPLVRYVFQTYSYGSLGCIEISRMVYKKFNIYLGKSNIDRMLQNKLYIGVKEKKRMVGPEEYIFWGLEKAGEHTESYYLPHITPIITNELFEKCKKIRESRYLSSRYERTGKQYPAIFSCGCGRRIRRDDKKGIKYLRCTNQMNNKFTVSCGEPYIHLEKIEKEACKIIDGLFPSQEIINSAILRIDKEIKINGVQKNTKILNSLNIIDTLQQKLQTITQSYIDEKISKEFFESTGQYITQEIDSHTTLLKSLQHNNDYILTYKKVIEFLKVLKVYIDKWETYQNNKKSSQLFSLLFKCVANLTIVSGNIGNYLLSTPFNMLQNTDFTDWGTV